jgi:hypothetical protein
MAKLTVSSLLEISRWLATPAGKELAGFLEWVSDTCRQLITAVNRGLTFRDNFAAEAKTVSLVHNTFQVIALPAGRVPSGIIVQRVVSATVGWDSLAWYIDDQDRLQVRVGFTGAPTAAQDVSLVILF